jgi:hypothetical protein
MANPPINLIDSQFQHSLLFEYLPLFDAIFYEGHPEGHIQRYKALREDQECILIALSIIRKEEDFLWAACEDLFERTVRASAPRLHGIFTYDLLSFDLHREVKTFKYDELATMLAKTGFELKPGEQRLIKYSSAYGILQKMVPESWGKITLKTAVEVYKDKPIFLNLLIKRLFKYVSFAHNPVIILVHDLSSEPIYDPENQEQQRLLRELMDAQSKETIEFLPEVYIQDKNGARELLSGMVFRGKK